MQQTGTKTQTGHSLYTALEMINDRMESLALIMNQMTDNPGFYAKHPVNQSQIDGYFSVNR